MKFFKWRMLWRHGTIHDVIINELMNELRDTHPWGSGAWPSWPGRCRCAGCVCWSPRGPRCGSQSGRGWTGCRWASRSQHTESRPRGWTPWRGGEETGAAQKDLNIRHHVLFSDHIHEGIFWKLWIPPPLATLVIVFHDRKYTCSV